MPQWCFKSRSQNRVPLLNSPAAEGGRGGSVIGSKSQCQNRGRCSDFPAAQCLSGGSGIGSKAMKTRLRIIVVGAWVLFLACGDRVVGAELTPPAKTVLPTVRMAGIVLKWIRGDKEANLRRIEPMIRQAAAQKAQIVVTTECFLDGYAIADKTMPLEVYRSLGEPIPQGKYYRRLAALAADLKIHLVAGLHEVEDQVHYNTAVLIGPDGKLLGKYRKQELGHELDRNKPGTESSVFSTAYGRVGIMICADRTKPAIVRQFRDRGADFLLCPSGGMFGPKTNDPIVQARSRENQRHIVFVHPAEFLVTGPDGSVVERTILGAVC